MRSATDRNMGWGNCQRRQKSPFWAEQSFERLAQMLGGGMASRKSFAGMISGFWILVDSKSASRYDSRRMNLLTRLFCGASELNAPLDRKSEMRSVAKSLP